MSFLGEIRRRKVFQGAALYLVIAWLIMQVVDVINDPLGLPDWFDTLVITLLAIGFPFAVMFSWLFDLTDEGVVRDSGKATGDKRMEYVLGALLVLAVGWIGFRELNPPASGGTEILPNSVAVLPCDNFSPNPEDAYFALGTHEEMLNQLAKIRDLNVTARTSVLQYAGVARPITEIARELRVEAVLECSVSYAEGRVAIAAQLIDAETGTHLWSERFNEVYADLFTIQAEIAQQIAVALEAELLPAELERIEARPTNSTEAYDLYLRSLALIVPAVAPNTRPAHLANLNKAIELDPSFALAYARRANIYVSGSDQYLDLAYADAEMALRLDPGVANAHVTIGRIHQEYGQWPQARAAYLTALKLSRDGESLFHISRFFSYSGEHAEAIRLARLNLELGSGNLNLLIQVLANAGQLDEAASYCQEAIKSDPANGVMYSNCAVIQIARGNNVEALSAARRAEALWAPMPSWGVLQNAYVHGRLGRSDHVETLREKYGQLEPDLDGGAETTLALAERNSDQAFRRLSEYVRSLENGATTDLAVIFKLKSNWWNDPILNEARFVELRRQLAFGGI